MIVLFFLQLGMYKTPTLLTLSGGYTWIIECCPGGRKYVSIFSGSIFALGLNENISFTSVLKLIYHWSCQTSIANVENWVKVTVGVIVVNYCTAFGFSIQDEIFIVILLLQFS